MGGGIWPLSDPDSWNKTVFYVALRRPNSTSNKKSSSVGGRRLLASSPSYYRVTKSQEAWPSRSTTSCRCAAPVAETATGGPNPVYHVLGQTAVGRYLLCVVIAFPDGNGYPITARAMTDNEKRRFRDWKSR